MSLPEDGVDGATGIGSGTRRKMYNRRCEDGWAEENLNGMKFHWTIRTCLMIRVCYLIFLIFACNLPSRHLYPLCRLFHHLLPTILRQHPPHLALKYQPPIRHHIHNHTRYTRNNSLVLSLPPALLPCSSLTLAMCSTIIFHLLNSNNSSYN